MCKPNLLSSFRVAHTYVSVPESLGFSDLEEAYPQRRLRLFIEGQDPVRFPPSTLSCQLVQSLCRSCLGNGFVEMSWVQLPCPIKDALGESCTLHTMLWQTSPSSDVNRLSAPFFCSVANLYAKPQV